MTASQYKNIIEWTLFLNEALATADNLVTVRRIMDNLGVSFPNGDYKDIINALQTNTFLGWRVCTSQDAQRYADIGIATIAVTPKKVIVICPNSNVNNLSGNEVSREMRHNSVVHLHELSQMDLKEVLFFTYRYGFLLDQDLPSK